MQEGESEQVKEPETYKFLAKWQQKSNQGLPTFRKSLI